MRQPWLTTLLVLAFALTPILAGAGDEGEGDSAAEQAYRDGWWAETAKGALDVAKARYEQAAAAAGPDAVRARALYRLGVVLERMGKTEEAIRALERLAREFPAEEDLQREARERLQEWTAVDLREDFQEWYRRYLFSPEFQARVVEHVLNLGSSANSGHAITALVTIGEPAIPALRAHLDSPNQMLRKNAVDILLRLGHVPEARHLLGSYDWMSRRDNWSLLLALSDERKAELRAQVKGDGNTAEALRHVLDDRESWPAALLSHPAVPLLDAILAQPTDEDMLANLVELVDAFDAHPSFAERLATRLLDARQVSDEQALAWLAEGPVGINQLVAGWLAERTIVATDAWRAVLDQSDRLSPLHHFQKALWQAFLGSVDGLPPESLDMDRIRRSVERLLPGHQVSLPTGGSWWPGADPAIVQRLLAAMVEKTRDPNQARSALGSWTTHFGQDAASARQLLAWAENEALDPSIRESAVRMAGPVVSPETLDDVLDALPRLEPRLGGQLVSGLAKNRQLQTLPWTDVRLVRLMAWIREHSGTVHGYAGKFFKRLHEPRHRVEDTLRLALASPEQVWAQSFANLSPPIHAAILGPAHEGFRQAWPRWSVEQRGAALEVLNPFLWNSGKLNEETTEFLRAQLRGPWPEPPDADALKRQLAVRYRIVYSLPEIEVEDLRAGLDLTQPSEAVRAVATLHGRFPSTPEAYEALAAAKDHPDPMRRGTFWTRWDHISDPDLRRRAAADMLEDSFPHHRAAALRRLANPRHASDVPRFAKALEDPDWNVRLVAAQLLAKQWDDAAVKALVKALDDPQPDVRDTVLQTLETIKKIEDQKEFWRKSVEDR